MEKKNTYSKYPDKHHVEMMSLYPVQQTYYPAEVDTQTLSLSLCTLSLSHSLSLHNKRMTYNIKIYCIHIIKNKGRE